MYSLTLKHTCMYIKVNEVIDKNRSELLERRYAFPVGKLMGAVREGLKWADGKLVKETIEKQVKLSHRAIDPFLLSVINNYCVLLCLFAG